MSFEHAINDNTPIRNTPRCVRVKQDKMLTATMGGVARVEFVYVRLVVLVVTLFLTSLVCAVRVHGPLFTSLVGWVIVYAPPIIAVIR